MTKREIGERDNASFDLMIWTTKEEDLPLSKDRFCWRGVIHYVQGKEQKMFNNLPELIDFIMEKQLEFNREWRKQEYG